MVYFDGRLTVGLATDVTAVESWLEEGTVGGSSFLVKVLLRDVVLFGVFWKAKTDFALVTVRVITSSMLCPPGGLSEASARCLPRGCAAVKPGNN